MHLYTVRDYVLPVLVFFVLAGVVHRLSNPIAKRFTRLRHLSEAGLTHRLERQKTLRALLSSAISVLALCSAIVLSLSLFVSLDTLIWIIGLFSAAFGLGARPFISDYLTGLSFMFENTFDVGEKIEIPLYPHSVEGVVEEITLRVTRIRGMNGELYTMPNGDIRLIRNFSRGRFSPASVTLKIPSADLKATLLRLEALKQAAMTLLPNLVEPWEVISTTGEVGEFTELTVLAKARFGKGAVLKLNLAALLQDQLSGQRAMTGEMLDTSLQEVRPQPDTPEDRIE